MKVDWPVVIWLCVMGIAFTLIVIGLVCQTIALHPDAMGFLP